MRMQMTSLIRTIVASAAALSLGASALADVVVAKVVSVGFPAMSGTGAVVRFGQWFPVHVQLSLQGTGTITRTLKLESVDLDGDRMAIIRPDVTISAEGGGAPRDVWCYGLANSSEEMPTSLVLLDENGEAHERVPLPVVDWLPNDDLLVVDLSDQAVIGLMRMMTPAYSPGGRFEGTRDYYRNIVVSKMQPAELPDRWIGLEAVDVIVWDQPGATDLKRIGPIDALTQWVDNGGQLIIGVGSAWPALRGSAVGARLPLAGEGVVAELNDLPVFRERFVSGAAAERPLDRVVLATVADLAPDAVRTLGEFAAANSPRGSINMIAMRAVGAGRVVSTAAALRDLTPGGTREGAFFASLLELNPYSEDEKKQQSATGQQMLGANYVYGDIASAIGFGTATALRSMLAFFFVATYAFVATAGTWFWLTHRKQTTASWTAFLAVAVLASAVSLGTVGLTRGCSSGIQTLQVIDLAAGELNGRGHALFGYRSPTRTRDTLALAGSTGFLRPLARSPLRGPYFVTPDRYVAEPAAGKLSDVLVRATLKQTEGYWSGELGGTIQSRLTIDRSTGRITPDSYIANDLDQPIRGGVLLYADPRQDDAGVPRPAGLTELYDRPSDKELAFVPPSRNVLVASVGSIEAKSRVTEIASAAYRALDGDLDRWRRNATPKRSDRPDIRNLLLEHQAWQSAFGATATRSVLGVLLASTRNYFLHRRSAVVTDAWIPLSTEGIPDLDCTHWLISGRSRDGGLAGTAVLIAWTDAPGPAVLSVNNDPRPAYAGETVYRVRIPIEYVGSPPPRGGETP